MVTAPVSLCICAGSSDLCVCNNELAQLNYCSRVEIYKRVPDLCLKRQRGSNPSVGAVFCP